MKLLLLTNEYPPYIYGGAGVHVDNISQELSRLCEVEVRCFGDQKIEKPRLTVKGYENPISHYSLPKCQHRVFDALERSIHFNTDRINADLVHVHTWYTHWGGILAKINYGIPLVVTVHSLEPLRPWKREQLGAGYDFSTWVEKTALEMADAVIAVSQETKEDILRIFRLSEKKVHVIPNGIDPDIYKPTNNPDIIRRFNINPEKPFVLFMGRITRQKGLVHLVDAIPFLDKNLQVVLCAGAPDTKEIAQEIAAHIKKAKKSHPSIIWIKGMLSDKEKVALYSHATVFCCPSVYEPFGIINIEAMACQTPVVASCVGGIKEVVKHHETGFLIPVKIKNAQSLFAPEHPKHFSQNLARKINELITNEPLRKRMGKAGRRRVLQQFTWKTIAEKTFKLYQKLLK
ncbi:MAG TPA: glycogen synthase [Candidatus Omnitrophota bacterium]|nr:glycogen synthase [Candidatus Omnitrophota bacterium]HPN88950.1 glycogen synthase [Candidatus Omnitrophota bacterium]